MYVDGTFRILNSNEYELIYKDKIDSLSDVATINQFWITEFKKYILGNIYDTPNIFR